MSPLRDFLEPKQEDILMAGSGDTAELIEVIEDEIRQPVVAGKEGG